MRAVLVARFGDEAPSERTIARVLQRFGEIKKRRPKRVRNAPEGAPRTDAAERLVDRTRNPFGQKPRRLPSGQRRAREDAVVVKNASAFTRRAECSGGGVHRAEAAQ